MFNSVSTNAVIFTSFILFNAVGESLQRAAGTGASVTGNVPPMSVRDRLLELELMLSCPGAAL